jgi:RluA family pseudouridine synthase
MNAPDHESHLRRFLYRGAREVYRDDVLWVLDKPAGVLSHPNPGSTRARALLRGAYDFERERYRLRGPGLGERHVYLAHRLDLDTSGLILCAFEPGAAGALKEALSRREVKKEYRALLVGIPRRPAGRWKDHLRKTSRGERLEVKLISRREPNAVTGYRLLRAYRSPGLAFLSLLPETGRSHQLRVQAASRGFPIAGDGRYGDFQANRFLAREVGLKRMFLHAWGLELLHPRSGERLRFTCELSSRLAGPLRRLEDLRERVPRRRP